LSTSMIIAYWYNHSVRYLSETDLFHLFYYAVLVFILVFSLKLVFAPSI